MAKNDASLSKGKSTGSINAENTNMHKLMKMGMMPDVGGKGKPTTRP